MEVKQLWQPDEHSIKNSNLRHYEDWLNRHYGLTFTDYHDLWSWSVNEPAEFWESLWKYFEVISTTPYHTVLSSLQMPGAKWFDGASINFAEHIFRHKRDGDIAIIFENERGEHREVNWKELREKVASLRAYLVSKGITKGDRVVGFLPAIPEATIALLAVNSIGAIWSSASPDFGVDSVVDRFGQIHPKILIAVDGYTYNGKAFDKKEVVSEIAARLPELEEVILLPYLDQKGENIPSGYTDFRDCVTNADAELHFEHVPFEHPIWILYSSGTTGLPKAIVHSHGGILMEMLKYLSLQNDVKPGEKYFWFTTTGWMMWNFIHGPLLFGATMVIYDGSPAWPDMNALWSLTERVGISQFGTSAPYLVACMKKELSPGNDFDLSKLRAIRSTGSPLPAEAFDWVYEHVKKDLWLASMAGGTDVCTAFIGGNPYWPVHSGEIQCRALGCSLFAYDDEGKVIWDQLGEMVIDKPMPSMPVFFWNDPGNKKYIASYFEHFPGKWRHGDFIRINPDTYGLVIYGRSDATLNRHGVRIGTSEIYRAVDKVAEVQDALVINLELGSGQHYMPLFVQLKPGVEPSDDIKNNIVASLRREYSPRHVPDEIIWVDDLPYTFSGKKMETPVKKVLLGLPLDKSLNIDSMRNPQSIAFFMEYARKKGFKMEE